MFCPFFRSVYVFVCVLFYGALKNGQNFGYRLSCFDKYFFFGSEFTTGNLYYIDNTEIDCWVRIRVEQLQCLNVSVSEINN